VSSLSQWVTRRENYLKRLEKLLDVVALGVAGRIEGAWVTAASGQNNGEHFTLGQLYLLS
jgi:hypothetical protein